MALSYAHGSFEWLTSDALNSTQAISGLGFQPKAIRFWWAGLQSTTNASSSTSPSRRGVGFAVSASSRQCVIGYSADNSTASDDATMARDAHIAGIINGSAVIGGQLDISSFDSDGFTTIVDQVATANLTIFWEAWGGTDITNATIGQISEPAATGTVNYTATGFTAAGTDQVVMFAGCQSTAAFNTGLASDHGMVIGAATGTAGTAQWVMCGNSDDASASMDTDRYVRAGECYAMITVAGGNPSARANLSAFGTDLFTLNWTARATTARKGIYLAIKGGGWKAAGGTIDTTVVSNTAVVTGLGFTPVGLSGCTAEFTASPAGTAQGWDSWIIGCGTSSTSRRSMGSQNANATANSEIYLAIKYDAFLGAANTAGYGNSIDISSLDSDGFTLIVDSNTGYSNAAMWYGYLAFGTGFVPTTYPQTCYATATGSASFARVATFPRQLTTTGSASTTLGRQISLTFAAVGTAAASLARTISLAFATTGSGAASLTATVVSTVLQQCYATATATVSLGKKIVKTLAATGQGSSTLARTIGKRLSASGTGTASVVKTVKKTLAFTGSGAATVLRKISKTFSATGTGAASLADSYITTKQVSTTGTGTVSSTQSYIAAPPVGAWFRKMRRAALTYIRRR